MAKNHLIFVLQRKSILKLYHRMLVSEKESSTNHHSNWNLHLENVSMSNMFGWLVGWMRSHGVNNHHNLFLGSLDVYIVLSHRTLCVCVYLLVFFSYSHTKQSKMEHYIAYVIQTHTQTPLTLSILRALTIKKQTHTLLLTSIYTSFFF